MPSPSSSTIRHGPDRDTSPEKIFILTTCNVQKDLLQDILSQRCGPGTPLAGIRPGEVSTVDHYQGQQNN